MAAKLVNRGFKAALDARPCVCSPPFPSWLHHFLRLSPHLCSFTLRRFRFTSLSAAVLVLLKTTSYLALLVSFGAGCVMNVSCSWDDDTQRAGLVSPKAGKTAGLGVGTRADASADLSCCFSSNPPAQLFCLLCTAVNMSAFVSLSLYLSRSSVFEWISSTLDWAPFRTF